MRNVIISLAPVEAGCRIDKAALVEDVVRSTAAGAAMCHLHCRRPDGSLTPDITEISDTFEQIAARTDVIIQASTGGVSDMTIEERCNPLTYHRVESASLNGGTTNLGEAVYLNSLSDIRYCAKTVYEKKIIPEIEVFDIGMIYNVESTRAEVKFERRSLSNIELMSAEDALEVKADKGCKYNTPLLYNLVFGHRGGMQPNMKCLMAFCGAVPEDAIWGVTHYGRDNWDFLAAAIAMGASVVRIGFEDSHHLAPGITAEYNYELVEKLAALIRAMDLKVATVPEAREMIGALKRYSSEGEL